MIWLKRFLVMAATSGAMLAILLGGCSKDLGERGPNVEPETYLSFGPDEGGITNYRVRLNWFGWDPDGEIAHFRTRWDDDSDWRIVADTDSVFNVSASADSLDEQKGYEVHTFRVAAVDNDGLADASPESVSFTAFTFLPDTYFQVGGRPASTTGTMVSFRWGGSDRDGVITYYMFALYKRDQVSGQWEAVVAPRDTVSTSWNKGPLPGGLYRFDVWAFDDAGAWDQTPARAQFTVNPDFALGPKLFVATNVFGFFMFKGPVWASEFNVPMPIFAGERLRFAWVAWASDYGGEVVGYRHAYDDTSTWPAWSIFDTRFQVMPEPGRHSLYIGALDNANIKTRARIYFDVVEATLDQYILVVDDYDWREADPDYGTDEARTAFYDSLLAGYARPRVEWEPSEHIVSGQKQPPDVDVLRGASTVIWYCDEQLTTLDALFDPQRITYNALAGYLRVGGNLMLDGYKIAGQILDRQYPMQITAADTSLAGSFVRDYLHIGYAGCSGTNQNKSAPWSYGYCFYGAIPADDPEFEPIYLDSVGQGGYPNPGKWPMYVRQSPAGLVRAGLPNVEKLEAYQNTALETFTIDAYINMNYEGQTGGTLYLSGTNRGNTAYMGFPLYYCRRPGVQAYMDRVLYLFGEERIEGRQGSPLAGH